MAHAVETMAWVGDIPWHGLGIEVEPTLTPQEMLVAAGLDWTVSARPIKTTTDIPIVSHRMLMRDSDDAQFGICGSNYVPFQNDKVFEFFKRFTDAGDMEMHTAGSLRNGQHVWGLAKINKGFSLPGGDDVEGYLLLSQPHQWGKSLIIKFTPTRVVCNNTLTYALNQSSTAQGQFRMPHIQEFDSSIIAKAEDALGLASNQMDKLHEDATLLASKEFNDKKVDEYIARLFQPELLAPSQKEVNNNSNYVIDFQEFKANASLVREAIWKQPGNDLPTKNTWWAAANAVTYVVDHKLGRERDAAMFNAWFGKNATLKRKAIETAVEYAKAA